MDFLFVDGKSAAFRADEGLGGALFGEPAVLVGAVAEDAEAASVAHRNGESRVREGPPTVGVLNHWAACSVAMDRGDSPVEPDAIAWPARVFAECIRGGSGKAVVRRQ